MNTQETVERSEQVLPKISYTVVYTNHRIAKDFEWIPAELEECDIFIPEVYRWNNDTASTFKDVSSGKISPDRALENIGISPDSPWHSSWHAEMIALHNTGKRVVLVDLPGEHELSEQIDFANYRAGLINPDLPFDMLLAKFRQRMVVEAQGYKIREEHILQVVEEKVKKTVEEDPELRAKNQVRVLMWLGAHHTPVARGLNERGVDISMRFSIKPFPYVEWDKAVRMFRFGLEPREETLAKAMLNDVFLSVFQNELKQSAGEDWTIIDDLMSRILKSLTLGEIRALFEKSRRDEHFNMGLFVSNLKSEIETKGFRIPESEKDFDGLLGRIS